jgi:hypothetical protein
MRLHRKFVDAGRKRQTASKSTTAFDPIQPVVRSNSQWLLSEWTGRHPPFSTALLEFS